MDSRTRIAALTVALAAALALGTTSAGEPKPAGQDGKTASAAAEKIIWGRPSGGLTAGLSATSTEFEADRPLAFTVRLVNLGNTPLKLRAALSPQSWKLHFQPERGGPALVASPAAKAAGAETDLVLEPGAGRELGLDTSGRTYSEDPPQQKPGKPLAVLPPGAYTVTASFSAAAAAGSDAWQDTAVSGQLRVEVVRSEAQVAKELAGLQASAQAAEKAYAAARTKPTHDAYVMASEARLQAMVNAAEEARPGSDRRKRMAKAAVDEIRAWLKHQDDARYEAPTEGASMWMHLYLGLGLRLAGEPDLAVKDGFDKTLGYSPEKFPPPGQPWAWTIWLNAKLQKAQVLADKGEWKLANGEIDPAFAVRVESRGKPLGIRARLLSGTCLGKLGHYHLSAEEFKAALTDIEKLRERGGDLARQADDLRRRAVYEMGEMVAAAVIAGQEVRGGN